MSARPNLFDVSSWQARLRRSGARLRAGWSPVAQSALAAGASWALARRLLGVEQPLFAPVAAMVALGISSGRRGTQAVQVVLGVAFGVGVADVAAEVIGQGAAQIAVVVTGTMAVAVATGASRTFVMQAAISGLLVAAAPRPAGALVPQRFLEALVGGGVALVFSQLLFPLDPERLLRTATDAHARRIAELLEAAATALRTGDNEALARLADDVRALDGTAASLDDALAIAHATVRHAPMRRRRRSAVARYERSARHLHAVARDVVPLLRLIRRTGDARDLQTATASVLDTLADGVAHAVDDASAVPDAAELVRAAAALQADAGLTGTAFAAQVDAIVDDLLRAAGLSARETREALSPPADPDGFSRRKQEAKKFVLRSIISRRGRETDEGMHDELHPGST